MKITELELNEFKRLHNENNIIFNTALDNNLFFGYLFECNSEEYDCNYCFLSKKPNLLCEMKVKNKDVYFVINELKEKLPEILL